MIVSEFIKNQVPWIAGILLCIFCLPAAAQDKYEVHLKSGKTIVTSDYYEEGDAIVYYKFGATIRIPKSHVKQIRPISSSHENVEAVVYSDENVKSAKTEGKKKKPQKKLTAEEKIKLREQLEKCRKRVEVIRKGGPYMFAGEATIATVQSQNYVTPEQYWKTQLSQWESRCKSLERRLE